MDQEAFLKRVREAAHSGQKYRVATRDLPAEVGYVGGGNDLPARFVAEVNAVGGEAVLVADAAAARAALAALLARYAVRSAVLWQHDLLDRLEIADLLKSAGVTADDFASLSNDEQPQQRLRVLAAEIGITSCDWAIAETGTLVMLHRPGQERMASLVPPVHVALVERTQIVPDLFDVFAKLDAAALPSNITLITGPSKTGDIELQLTTGVHGPKHWHVIVMA